MGRSVLGHDWDPRTDLFTFALSVNLSKRNRDGQYIKPDLTPNSLRLLDQHVATKRSVLSAVAGFYNPAELISAYLIKFWLFLREIAKFEKLTWDKPLPPSLQDKWKELVQEVINLSSITLPCCVRTCSAFGPSKVISYWDGSKVAYATAIYLQYAVRDDKLGP